MKNNSTVRISLQSLFISGVATVSMDALVMDPVITGFAVMLGASNIAIGFLAAIPYMGNLSNLVSAYLLEKDFSIKKLAVISSFISRIFYLLIAFLAFFADTPYALPLLIVFYALTYLIGSITGGIVQPWMKVIIPINITHSYFSNRLRWMMVGRVVCFGIASFVLMYFRKYYPNQEIYAYSLLFLLAFILGVIATAFLYFVKEVKIEKILTKAFLGNMLSTFKNKFFKNVVLVLGTIRFATVFFTSFTTIFLLKILNVPIASILILNLVSQVFYIIFMKKLGIYTKQHGLSRLLNLSIILFILTNISFLILNIYAVSNYAVLIILLVLIYAILGIANAGNALGINNSLIVHTPTKSSHMYIAVNNMFSSAMAAISPIIAGFLLTFYEKLFLSDVKAASTGWSLFFITTLFLFIITIVYVKRVKV